MSTSFETGVRPPIAEVIAAGNFLPAAVLNDPNFSVLGENSVELGLALDCRLAVNGMMRNLNVHHVGLLNILGVIPREEYITRDTFCDLGFGSGLKSADSLRTGFSRAMNRLRWAVSRPDGESLIDQQPRRIRSGTSLFALNSDAHFVDFMTRNDNTDAADARAQAATYTDGRRLTVAEVFLAQVTKT